MAANYVLLERVTVGETAVSSITFNSIPQTGYTDLKIVYSARDTSGSLLVSINGNSASLTGKGLYGSGSAAASENFSGSIGLIGEPNTYTANTFASGELYFPNYTSSSNKSFSYEGVNENNAAAAYMEMTAGLWSNTSAITSITLTAGSSGSIFQYSTFSLYGLAAIGTTPTKAPKASGGSIIQTDGTYWYHAFLASGTFTPAVGLSCDVLVVAGGGGGAYGNGGPGGGAGGMLAFNSQTVTASAQAVAVGAGGVGGFYNQTSPPTLGVDSQFASLTLVKGGGAWNGSASGSIYNGVVGGSGSGGNASGGTGGAGTSGQGNAGGAAYSGSPYSSGGGGGKGGVGGSATGGAAGAGGAGDNTYSSWLTTVGQVGVSGYLAGGGGGGATLQGASAGAAGSGGGGAGYSTVTTDKTVGAGKANAGGGGGGGKGDASNNGVGGNGGSGIVIIRYLAV